MTDDHDAERLVSLCREGRSDWVQVLRQHARDIAVALDGAALTIEVNAGSGCRFRLGVLPSGRVVCPLGGDDEPDARLVGTAEDVAAFLLGRKSLLRAEMDGLLEFKVVNRPDRERLARFRGVVSEALRELLAGPSRVASVLVPGWLRKLARALDPALNSVLAPCVPVFAAACTGAIVGTLNIAEPAAQVVVVSDTRPPAQPSAPASTASRTTGLAVSGARSGALGSTKLPRAAPTDRGTTASMENRVSISKERPDGGSASDDAHIVVNCSKALTRPICAVVDAVPSRPSPVETER